ncbi:NUDIX domain-containing protein [Chloroflexota bacterium]
MSDKEPSIVSSGSGCILPWPLGTIIKLFGFLFPPQIKPKGKHKRKKRQVSTRRRGTAIVETEQGIVVTAGRNKVFLLPGGGANRNESRTQAAMRELREETGLRPFNAQFLFRFEGRVVKSHGPGYFQDHHTVCLIKASGTPRPHNEIRYIRYYKPESKVRLSGTTKKILERYYAMKGHKK